MWLKGTVPPSLIFFREITTVNWCFDDEVRPSSLKSGSLSTASFNVRPSADRRDITLTCHTDQVQFIYMFAFIYCECMIAWICLFIIIIFLQSLSFLFHRLHFRYVFVMGNSASTSFITPTPRRLSWGRQKEDKVKLEDFLTECEEDLWKIKGKQSVFVRRANITRSIRYFDLAMQDGESCFPNSGEMLNPAFVGDQGPWTWTLWTRNKEKGLLSCETVRSSCEGVKKPQQTFLCNHSWRCEH